MTCRVIGMPLPRISLILRTHGDKGTNDDEEHMDNLRLILATALANYVDCQSYVWSMTGDLELDHLAQILMSEPMHQRGRVRVEGRGYPTLAMCSYINYTRVTSDWAKQAYPGCTVQITVRLIEAIDDLTNVVDAHTLVIYF